MANQSHNYFVTDQRATSHLIKMYQLFIYSDLRLFSRNKKSSVFTDC